jgi:putative isomerase
VLQRNLAWWERERHCPELGVFCIEGPAGDISGELGLDNSPRFDPYDDTIRRICPIDLNSQMVSYYQTMAVAGSILEDPESGSYFERTRDLQERAQELFWDDERAFFYDYDAAEKRQIPVTTASAFWALFGGVASKSQAEALVRHLRDPDEFWTECPVPSVALNDPAYAGDMWRGPTWVSQNLWFIIGLQRYTATLEAEALALRTLAAVTAVFQQKHAIYEFYDPWGGDPTALRRKGPAGPHPHYLGHMPLHSLVYRGILCAQILDDSLNFTPIAKEIPEPIRFQVWYRGRRVEGQIGTGEPRFFEIVP